MSNQLSSSGSPAEFRASGRPVCYTRPLPNPPFARKRAPTNGHGILATEGYAKWS